MCGKTSIFHRSPDNLFTITQNPPGPMPGRIRAQLRKDYDQATHRVPYDPETLQVRPT